MERDLVGAETESSATAQLLRAYHQRGDAAARQRLVELYLPLVDSLVRRHTHTGDDYDDLYQVGCIGLINAIDRFDSERGAELAAFAVPNIAGEIRRYLRDRSATVRLPRRVLELRGRTQHAQADLAARLGRSPTTAEVAAEVGADEQDVALALDAARASSALELDAAGDGADVATGSSEDRLFLAEAFRGLDGRERQIVYLRYMRDMPPAAVARELGMSERQLSRATQAALVKLRSTLEGAGSPAPPEPAPAPAKRLPRAKAEPKMAKMSGTGAAAPAPERRRGYHIELVRDAGPSADWIAQVAELSGVEGRGATPDEAVTAAEAAMETWIAEAGRAGREVPKPRSEASHSGRLMVRMPQSLHTELAQAAQREDVSLNQFITGALAAAVQWRSRGDASAESTPWMPRALLLNLIVLAIVGIVALILLVMALT
jgi:RNA polymerase sigma-B factor